MKLFEGKNPAERNKTIAALVLGAMALLALTYTFGGSFFGGRKTTVSVTATPSPTAAPRRNADTAALPTVEEENFIYTTTPVVYDPRSSNAPDAGRNIFAFYEPPPPTPYSPTPIPTQKPIEIAPPTPTPELPFLVGFVSPQSVYAGQKTFRLEVNGDKFTPESLIYLNGNQLPTTFISQQKLVAEVPSNFIAGPGAIQILVRTADGGLFSNQVALTVQAPPIPQFRYIGMIARQRFNNDTAYFEEQGKPTPLGARLNDVVGGRFRLMSISASETVFEDVNLGFKHRLALYRPSVGQQNPSVNPNQGQDPNLMRPGRMPEKGGFNPISPNNPNNPNPYPNNTFMPPPGDIPGIPNNIPIYNPTPPPSKDDEDDDKDGKR